MSGTSSIVVVGGTSGLGLELAEHYVRQGTDVVVVGRDPERARTTAEALGAHASYAVLDLARPHDIAESLRDVGEVRHLVLAAIERDANTVTNYDIDAAIRLATLKLVGYVEVVHALLDRIDRDTGSVLLFGGQAKERPYPGSTTVSTINGGVVGMVNTLATELAPLRVNAIHPGIVGDTPFWAGKEQALDAVLTRTPTGRLVTSSDVVHACTFLMENRSVNAVNLAVDGGWLLR